MTSLVSDSIGESGLANDFSRLNQSRGWRPSLLNGSSTPFKLNPANFEVLGVRSVLEGVGGDRTGVRSGPFVVVLWLLRLT